ncbi:MAG: hypothetical protein WBG46_06410 [Nonlabens sp.]
MRYHFIHFRILSLIICFGTQVQSQTLNELFENALISDLEDNITRQQPIIITEVDINNRRLKTNYKQLEKLKLKESQGFPWVITQGEEAEIVVEISNVDIHTGWISLSEAYSRSLIMEIGEKIEFFNPFLNYRIINERALFDLADAHVEGKKTKYVQAGGIIERGKQDYILLTPIVFNHYESRAIYYAKSTDLENWEFTGKKLLDTENIPFAKHPGNVFSTGNPILLEDGNYLVLLGVEQSNGRYTSAYMIINSALVIVIPPKEIQLLEWHGVEQNSYPLSMVKHDGIYRFLMHRRSKNVLESQIYEYTTQDILKTFEGNLKPTSERIIHNAKNESGYLHGKADDASYLVYKDELYILTGSEETGSEYLTSNNRQYGLMFLENNTWKHDKRSPLILNPIGYHNKYPELLWTDDHLGGFISPIFKNGYLYLFMTFGTDNPDYIIAGLKIPLRKND